MLRDLLVHVDGSEHGRRRVRFAMDLAERQGARFSGIHVTPPADVPPLYKPSVADRAAGQLASELGRDARAAKAIFLEETKRRTADADWREVDGDIVENISDEARYADLVIVGQYEWQSPAERHPLPIAHSLVLRCGRPVLVVPGAVQIGAINRFAVAWDGSRESVRAAHDALPLLKLARSVQIVTMIPDSAVMDERGSTRLSTHFLHHGIKIAPDLVQVRTEDEHASLRRQIDQGQYDLLVMGGYSHPRWMEFIFGGATRSILMTSKIPVLISH